MIEIIRTNGFTRIKTRLIKRSHIPNEILFNFTDECLDRITIKSNDKLWLKAETTSDNEIREYNEGAKELVRDLTKTLRDMCQSCEVLWQTRVKPMPSLEYRSDIYKITVGSANNLQYLFNEVTALYSMEFEYQYFKEEEE